MNSLTIRTLLGAAALVVIGAALIGSFPLAAALASAILTMAGLAYVAFAAQSSRIRDEARLVYRPVYVRNDRVRRRIRSFDD